MNPRTILAWGVLVAALTTSELHAQQLRTPAPSTPRQDELVSEGIRLADERRYDEAILRYDSVLAMNPENVFALYEKASAYRWKKELDSALAVAGRGAEFASEIWSEFYLLMGGIDEERRAWNDMAVRFQRAVTVEPSNYLFWYNLGYAHAMKGRSNDAFEALRQSILLNPDYSTAHVMLGALFDSHRYRIPAILAYLRGLVVAPGDLQGLRRLEVIAGYVGWRTGNADTTPLQIISGWRGWGTFAPKSNLNAFIERPFDLNTDEGNFARAATILNQARAGRAPGYVFPSSAEKFVTVLDRVVAALPEPTGKEDALTMTYYVPYFKAARRDGHLKALAYYVMKLAKVTEATSWLNGHAQEVEAFLEWNRNYSWPKLES